MQDGGIYTDVVSQRKSAFINDCSASAQSECINIWEFAWEINIYQDTRLCLLRPKKLAHHTVSMLTGRNCDFHVYVTLSLIQLKPNLLQKCLPGRGVYMQKLKKITSTISENEWQKFWLFFLVFKKNVFCFFYIFFSYTLQNLP